MNYYEDTIHVHVARRCCPEHPNVNTNIDYNNTNGLRSIGAGAIRHGGARALPLLELAGHGGAQIEQERLSGWAPSLCHKILHCILQVYADMHLTHFTLLEVYLLN